MNGQYSILSVKSSTKRRRFFRQPAFGSGYAGLGWCTGARQPFCSVTPAEYAATARQSSRRPIPGPLAPRRIEPAWRRPSKAVRIEGDQHPWRLDSRIARRAIRSRSRRSFGGRGDVHAPGLVYGRPVPGGRGRRLAEKTGGSDEDTRERTSSRHPGRTSHANTGGATVRRRHPRPKTGRMGRPSPNTRRRHAGLRTDRTGGNAGASTRST